MRELSRQDLEDILNGAAILGAGGGGDLSEGMGLVDHAFAAGKSFKLVSLDDVPDDALLCTPYLLGAISGLSEAEERGYARLSRVDTHPLLTAYAAFQADLGQAFYGTIACELGGSNTAAAFFPAAMNDHYVIDADPAGRAVPEITHSTYFLAGLPAAPIYTANEFGETFVLKGVQDDMRAETIVRALSTVSRHDISAIDHALPARDLRAALIPGTITKAQKLGAASRAARAAGQDVAKVVAHLGEGFVAFEGQITACHYETREGFTLGDITIAGSGVLRGREMRVSVKNENMACWVDGTVYATVPDLICLFDRATGMQIPNPDCAQGQEVSVVLLPSPDVFRTERGLQIFGPAYAGVDAPYAWPRPLVSEQAEAS